MLGLCPSLAPPFDIFQPTAAGFAKYNIAFRWAGLCLPPGVVSGVRVNPAPSCGRFALRCHGKVHPINEPSAAFLMPGPRVGEDDVATQPEGERVTHSFGAAIAARMTARLPLQERLSSNRVSPMGCRLGAAPRCRYVHDMCGRARLSSDVSEIKLVFSIPPERPTPNFPPSWNVAPTDHHAQRIVRRNP
jgi:hypothetical protein